MKKIIFYPSLLIAAVALVAYLWPISREDLKVVIGPDGKFGYINTDGRVTHELEWHLVGSFDAMGMTTVSTEDADGWYPMDSQGNVLPGPWDFIGEVDEQGMANAGDGSTCRVKW